MPALIKKELNLNQKIAVCLVSMAAALLIISGALFWRTNQNDTETAGPKSYNRQELAAANGKDGNHCLVAVDGTVYLIENSDLWKDGQHTTSNGLAYCGADLSEAIKQSPHGKSKLEQLEKAGIYNP